MTTPLLFAFGHQFKGRTVRAIGLAPSVGLQTASILEPALSRFLRRERLPDQIVVFGSDADRPLLQAVFSNEDVKTRVSGLSDGPSILPVIYEKTSHKIVAFSSSDWSSPLGDVKIQALRQASMQAIFRDLSGMLHGSTSHHYVKPSEKHADRFIRTANVLQTADSVHLIGLWLAEQIATNTKFVYCDTSSIGTVAYQALLHRFGGDPRLLGVTVDSFRSYEGLASYEFRDVKQSVAVISASTSGDLAQRLIKEKGFSPDRVITLFYLGDEAPPATTLCNLTKDPVNNPSGFEPIKSHAAKDCPHCHNNSLATMIVGDQFLTERPRIATHTITGQNAPKWLGPLMAEFRHHSIFVVHRHDPAVGRPVLLNVDLSSALGADAPTTFARDLARTADRSLPASTRYLIHENNAGSKALASYFQKHIKQHTQNHADLIHFGELAEKVEQLTDGAVVVVVDSVSDSRELMNVNRLLRKRAADKAAVYVIGFALHDSEAAYTEMRSNLTFGDGQPGRFGFDCIRRCHLPRPNEKSPWDLEVTFLNDLAGWCEGASREFPQFLERRRELLQASTKDGLSNDLFLPRAANEQRLGLRKDFAFFNSNEAPEKISQSAVFVTMAAILHDLRQTRAGVSPLHNEYYRRSLLSPANFDRFNDGVIQASILRAAQPVELAFAQDPALSHSMGDLVESTVKSWNSEQGEASLEFLLAICLERLELCPEDLERIALAATNAGDEYGVCRLLGTFIREGFKL